MRKTEIGNDGRVAYFRGKVNSVLCMLICGTCGDSVGIQIYTPELRMWLIPIEGCYVKRFLKEA